MKNYQKPSVEVITFQETENIMVSATGGFELDSYFEI